MVRNLLIEAQKQRQNLIMGVVNLGELWYTLARQVSASFADYAIQETRNIGFEIVPADWPLTSAAANIKSQHKLSFADAYAVALTRARNATIVTADPEIQALHSQLQIYWLGK